MINRQFFFDHVRANLFDGHMQQSQVNGMTAILDYWESKLSDDDDRWLAYALATTFHETAFTMQPIEEFGKGRGHPYGKPDPKTGQTYYGRGFVQLTWLSNYQKMGNLLGVDLVDHPELALQLDIATEVLFTGMIKGIFTGKKLGDFFNRSEDDWIHARTIINALDRAGQIAQYGHSFYAAISYTTAAPLAAVAANVPTSKPQAAAIKQSPRRAKSAPARA
jgi:putative chitinase